MLTASSNIATQTIGLLYDALTAVVAYYSPIQWVRGFVWVMDVDAKTASIKYKYLTWGWALSTSVVTTNINSMYNKTNFNVVLANADHRYILNPRYSIDNLNINYNSYLSISYNSVGGTFNG
jgi:hypothetical protein